ncbi:MAG: hypothetical protein WCA46_17355 [Actinocatenispora sp.]
MTVLSRRPAELTARRVTAEVLRGLTAAGVLLSADIHLELWVQGFQRISVIGPLFMLNAIGGLVIALAVLIWRHWLPTLAAVGFGAATLAAFLISATAGLFGVHETFGGAPQQLAGAADILTICCGLGLLVTQTVWRRSGR